LLARRPALDRRLDLLQPLLELARGSGAVVKQVAGLTVLVDEPALIEITIDRLEDRDAAGSLMHRQPLGRRELERLGEFARDLSPRASIRRGE
jgi:hypothetical protein